MKIPLYILIAIFIFGCKHQIKKNTEPRIVKFETFLGKEESDALTNLVETFELFLKYNFDNQLIENSYKEFLNETLNNDLENIVWSFDQDIQDQTFELIQNSGLGYEIYIKPINVWKEGNYIKDLYRYIDKQDTFEIHGEIKIPIYYSSIQQDSLIERLKIVSTFNRYGRFFRGLDLIKENDTTIINYLDVRNDLGNPPKSIIAANILLAKDSDYSDYFLKRIIAVELYKLE